MQAGGQASRFAFLLGVGGAVMLCLSQSGAAGTPTTASWSRAANAICSTQDAKIRGLPKLTSANLLSDFKATYRFAVAGDSQLAAIPRPRREAKTIATLVALSRSAEKLVAAQIIPDVERGDQAALARLQVPGNKLNSRLNALSRTLGARVCAENPSPSAENLSPIV